MYRLDEIDAGDWKGKAIVFKRGVLHLSPLETTEFDFILIIADVATYKSQSVTPQELYDLAENDNVAGVTRFEDFLCVSILSQRAYECLGSVSCVGILASSSFRRKLTVSDKERMKKYSKVVMADGLSLGAWNEGFFNKSNAIFYSASWCMECFERVTYTRRSYDVYEEPRVSKNKMFGLSNVIDLILLYPDYCFFYNSGRNFTVTLWHDDSFRYPMFECSPKFMLEVCG